ncbi:MAG: cache domain-containing protein [Bryobacteraceae bacterium]
MPTPEKFAFRITPRRLLISLLVTIIPLSLAGFYVSARSDKALSDAIGGQFQTLAETSAAAVSNFIHDRVIDVGVMASSPLVIDAVTASNRSYGGADDNAARAAIQKIDRTWATPAAAPLVNRIITSPAAKVLIKYRELDPKILRITVTDEHGATVAASHKTLDYFQADEEYWQNIYAEGRGSVSLTDVLYDEVTKASYVGVGVPVMEEGTNRFIGTVDALIDVTTMFQTVRLGSSLDGNRTMLVKADGTIIAGPQITLSMNRKSNEYAALLEARALEEPAGYVIASVTNAPRSLIAFSDTGLKRDYQKLDWAVLVAQDVQHALAPVRSVTRLIAFLSLIALAGVTLLAAYIAMHHTLKFDELGELRRGAAGSPSAAASEGPMARRV